MGKEKLAGVLIAVVAGEYFAMRWIAQSMFAHEPPARTHEAPPAPPVPERPAPVAAAATPAATPAPPAAPTPADGWRPSESGWSGQTAVSNTSRNAGP
jgi:hypothetical protein